MIITRKIRNNFIKALVVLILIALMLYGLYLYRKYFDGMISTPECEERGGEMVIGESIDYVDQCPFGKKNIGKIIETSLEKYCCK